MKNTDKYWGGKILTTQKTLQVRGVPVMDVYALRTSADEVVAAAAHVLQLLRLCVS